MLGDLIFGFEEIGEVFYVRIGTQILNKMVHGTAESIFRIVTVRKKIQNVVLLYIF